MSDCVLDYFSLRASDYNARSAQFPWAWVRARELSAVRSLMGDISGSDVLELGAGAGFYTRELLRWGADHVHAVDISAAMLARLPQERVTTIRGRAETIRLDRRFSVLLSAGMLEFLPQPAMALTNAAAHAETGARFTLLVPRANVAGRLYRQLHRSHGMTINLFGRRWFETVAPRAGWRLGMIVPVIPLSSAVCLHRV